MTPKNRLRRSPTSVRAGRARGEQGLTLMELVVAISVFAILSSGVAMIANSGLHLVADNRDRTAAANLASEDSDAATQTDFNTLAGEVGSPVTSTKTVGTVKYTITRDVHWEPANSSTNICSYTAGGSTSDWLLAVTSSVSWPNRQGIPPASSTTTVSPPVGNNPLGNGATVPVTVHDADGNGLTGISVTATGGGSNTYTATTDSSGCAFFVVAPGTYTVSLSTAGYVDRTGVSTPSAVFSISKGGNVAETFDYDRAGSIVLVSGGPAGASLPSGVPIVLSYQFFQPSGTEAVAFTGFPQTLGNLFPDSYGLVAGDCADVPAGDPAAVPGGGTVTEPLSFGAVAVTATQSGLPAVGGTVTAQHDDTAGGTCTSGTANYTLGTTGATGQLLSGLPWGHWLISVNGSAPVSVFVDATQPNASTTPFSVSVSLP
jgi:prepilin-type N-terminal cleavage/methylation domain-containing protein